MISKSFITAFISVCVLVFVLFPVSQYLFYKEIPETGEFLQVIFWGVIGILPIVFVILCLLNYLVERVLKADKKSRPNSIYLFISLFFILVPIFLFIVYDNSDWGKDSGSKTLFSIMSDYIGVFLFSVIIILINRKIVWKNFKK